MRWRGRRQSSNVEDRRGRSSGRAVGGLGVLVIVGVGLLLGVDPALLLSVVGTQPTSAPTRRAAPPDPSDEQAQFVSVVLADTEDTWTGLFAAAGERYPPPTLVLFSGSVRSACGMAGAAVGPFYCPADQKIYIDLSFYRDLRDRFGAPGDFAQAYVIAHEVGHHIQTLLGISQEVSREQRRVDKTMANQLSVRLELQADCFAGIWAHDADRTRALLEQGDIEEGLTAAAAIGDDRLQRQAQGYVSPESFTHGTSAQRVRWFRRGYEDGTMQACDTFNTSQL